MNSVMSNFDLSLGKQRWAFQIQHDHESYLDPSLCLTLAFTLILASYQNSLQFLQFPTEFVHNGLYTYMLRGDIKKFWA